MTNSNFNDYTTICFLEKTIFIDCIKKPIVTEEHRNTKTVFYKKHLDKFLECIKKNHFKQI